MNDRKVAEYMGFIVDSLQEYTAPDGSPRTAQAVVTRRAITHGRKRLTSQELKTLFTHKLSTIPKYEKITYPQFQAAVLSGSDILVREVEGGRGVDIRCFVRAINALVRLKTIVVEVKGPRKAGQFERLNRRVRINDQDSRTAGCVPRSFHVRLAPVSACAEGVQREGGRA